jgi:uncharacterized protein
MSRPLQLLLLSDGKPGHRNQSLGLAEALARHTSAQHRIIELQEFPRGKKILHALRIAKQHPRPDWIIATGHGTHLCALALSRTLGSRSIILMKPSLPSSWFDACLIPTHDLKNHPAPSHIIPTIGALNRIQASTEKENIGLILIGGESKDYGFDADTLRDSISQILSQPGLHWHITDSRRTPASFLPSLENLPATPHPHQSCTADWLPAMLARSQSVWVTCDSVSMIYEALSSGARVGILPMPPRKESSKIARAITKLCDEGKIMTLKHLSQQDSFVSSAPLAEADRCAKILLEKLPLPLS